MSKRLSPPQLTNKLDMIENNEIIQKLKKLSDLYPEYKIEGYSFLLTALNFTVSKLSKPRHVSGQELLEGIRLFALDQFGPLAKTVLNHWGIYKTIDFGNMVFALIEVDLMRKNDDDSIEDFRDGFEFETAFQAKLSFSDDS